jgi:galactitol-specific phosphotransferase system IIC component
MEAFFLAFQQLFTDPEPSVALPIIIFIPALILDAKPGRAFRASVTIGGDFIRIIPSSLLA